MVTSVIATSAADMGKQVNVGVRPEDLVPTEDAGIYQARVDYTEALGDVTLLYFHHEGSNEGVTAKLPGIHMKLRDQVVKVRANPEKVHLFCDGLSMRK